MPAGTCFIQDYLLMFMFSRILNILQILYYSNNIYNSTNTFIVVTYHRRKTTVTDALWTICNRAKVHIWSFLRCHKGWPCCAQSFELLLTGQSSFLCLLFCTLLSRHWHCAGPCQLACLWPPCWPSGQGVCLESGRSRVLIPLVPGFFLGQVVPVT